MAGNRSPIATPLMDAISGWIAEQDPGAEVVPVILPGFTDSRHFREAFPECVAYGFFPHRHQSLLQTAPLIHAADERIDVRDLAFATRVLPGPRPARAGLSRARSCGREISCGAEDSGANRSWTRHTWATMPRMVDLLERAKPRSPPRFAA